MKTYRGILAAGALATLLVPAVSAKPKEVKTNNRDRQETRSNDNRSAPSGWSQGHKAGWKSQPVPPGQYRANENRNGRPGGADVDRDGVPDKRDSWVDRNRDGRKDSGEVKSASHRRNQKADQKNQDRRYSRADVDRDGIPDYRDSWVDANRNGRRDRGEVKPRTR
ncbi:MAG TPA: hypothetical protein VGM37_18840 [Armatimonadota bacterium]|jgi:hypothetical protein